MMDFLKRLFGGGASSSPTGTRAPAPRRRQTPPPLPAEIEREFLDWHLTQAKPAVSLTPDSEMPFDPMGSRLFGPALLQGDEAWPLGKDDKPLAFLAQINCADCQTLIGYPSEGFIQFFIGRDDLWGMEYEHLMEGNFLVRWIAPDGPLAPTDPPYLDEEEDWDDFSPALSSKLQRDGIGLKAETAEDYPDMGLMEMDAKRRELDLGYDKYDIYGLWDAMADRSINTHHTGGYPAFTQSDIREDKQFADFDHVLLRLTSDDHLMWGDAGECVFLMRSNDLARGDFSGVAYSWDCS